MSKYKAKDYISQDIARQMLTDLGEFADNIGRTKTLVQSIANGTAKFYFLGDKIQSQDKDGKTILIANEMEYSPDALVKGLKENERTMERSYMMAVPIRANAAQWINRKKEIGYTGTSELFTGDAASLREICRSIRLSLLPYKVELKAKGIEIKDTSIKNLNAPKTKFSFSSLFSAKKTSVHTL